MFTQIKGFAKSVEELVAKLKAEGLHRAVVTQVTGVKSSDPNFPKVQLEVVGFVASANEFNVLSMLNSKDPRFAGNKPRRTWVSADIEDAANMLGVSVDALKALPIPANRKDIQPNESLIVMSAVEAGNKVMKIRKLQLEATDKTNPRNLRRIPARDGKPEIHFFTQEGKQVEERLILDFIDKDQEPEHVLIANQVRREVGVGAAAAETTVVKQAAEESKAGAKLGEELTA